MTIGTSMFVIAVGAFLKYAVNREKFEGINIDTAGVILMVVGVAGLILGLFLYAQERRDWRRRDPDLPPPPVR